MSAHLKRFLLLVVVLVFAAAGCGKKITAPTSIIDSSGYHYHNGLTYLDSDRIDEAMTSFERAVTLDPLSPLGYIGRGLVFGRKGEFRPAFDNMSKAKDLDKGIESQIGMIRLYSMQREGKWIKDAENRFRAAKKKDPESARLHYFMGMAYKRALDFDNFESMLKAVLDRDPELSGGAKDEWALIQKIQRAAPGTEIAKTIALKDEIDRADLATLFDKEMNIEELLTRQSVTTSDTKVKALKEVSETAQTDKVIKMEAATDIADHRFRPSIERVLSHQIRGLEAGPDRTFDPDKLITRAEFALMLEDILIKLSGDEKLATRFLGATSPFTDVRNDQSFFNAAMTSTSKGFIEADKATGEFKPGDPVSGAEALFSIHEIKNQLAL
jgi:tetratricopeptide (TPR) repeat protein